MPSRRRPKTQAAPPPSALSDAARFAQSLRDSAQADNRAKQEAIDRKAEAERVRQEAIEQAEKLKRAQAAHQRAVELVKEAKRTGKGASPADLAWREAKADLIELETGKRPAWGARPAEPTEYPEPEPDEPDEPANDGEPEPDGE